MASIEVRDERFRKVVGDDVAMERVATGFDFTEGPIWHPIERHLTFSDMPGDQMRRWSQGAGVTTFRRPSDKANGNAWDRQGRIVTCEHATSRVTRTEADGAITVLATRHGGKQLNSPNDIVVGRDGSVVFTDPTFGRMEYYGVPREPELDIRGVYRVGADPEHPVLLVDDFDQPNGLCFTPDERRILVNDTMRGHIRVFEVTDDGALSGGDVWAEVSGEGAGLPDGLKVDTAGNVYCTGPGGVHVFTPDAVCLGVILVPEVTANFTWGDDDLRSIFFTASTSLYRCHTRTPGRDLFAAG